jgi:type IV secretory pathway VirB9-like protein
LKRTCSVIAVLVLLAASMLPPHRAVNAASFQALHYADNKQFVIKCSVMLECTVALEPGEEYNDAFNARVAEWEPHMAYEGGNKLKKPLLVLRPGERARETNVVLTTTRRTYYLELIPIFPKHAYDHLEPIYYNFQYDNTTYSDLNSQAIATQQAIRAQGGARAMSPSPTPTPADVADLASVCVDYDYSYIIARYLPDDHPHNAKPSSDPYPGTWKPLVVCSDGQHTYMQFTASAQAPVDLPVVLALTAEGDTVIKSTFNAARWRYTVNGVYDRFVLQVGSQYRPLRMVILHKNKDGVVPEQQGKHATPIPIVPPVTVAPSAPPMPKPVAAPSPVAIVAPSAVPSTSPNPVATASAVLMSTAAASAVRESGSPTNRLSTAFTTPAPSPSIAPGAVSTLAARPRSVAHPARWEFGGDAHVMWPTRSKEERLSHKRTSAVDVPHGAARSSLSKPTAAPLGKS